MATLVGLTRRDAVLDLGTGPGFLALDIAPLARTVIGVDPSEVALGKLTRVIVPGTHLACVRTAEGVGSVADVLRGIFERLAKDDDRALKAADLRSLTT